MPNPKGRERERRKRALGQTQRNSQGDKNNKRWGKNEQRAVGRGNTVKGTEVEISENLTECTAYGITAHKEKLMAERLGAKKTLQKMVQ